MTHQTATTSREAYRHLDTSHQERVILDHLRSISPDASCIADVAHALGWERSTVSARMNALKGVLEYTGKKPSKRTGITSMHWRVKVQETLFN